MSVRSGYHHGDLRNALSRAAADLAREGGPGAVTVRAAARAVGVTPTAAYRHFAGHEELLDAAKEQAMARMAAVMDAELARSPDQGDPVRRGLRHLAAVGLGYLNFAVAEPGLFRTCFVGGMPAGSTVHPVWTSEPFVRAIAVLDELAEAGYLPAERRPMAELAIWSSVHGLAMLLNEGPMRHAGPEIQRQAIERTFEVIAVGLGGSPLTGELRADLLEMIRRSGLSAPDPGPSAG
ncbi:TetR/AcrR family transcriptional regulator [Amycolatopsis acididurans]|uniref:TetR/AcrR family transcriptional regulator n=1 Tax=Amycolatopsis acididurans TaxID=2724524 RepID=UPI0028AA864F|nr:TetR/AcrR family transcriptional regulator [Amycolatopsis acididurans]